MTNTHIYRSSRREILNSVEKLTPEQCRTMRAGGWDFDRKGLYWFRDVEEKPLSLNDEQLDKVLERVGNATK